VKNEEVCDVPFLPSFPSFLPSPFSSRVGVPEPGLELTDCFS
jgi:hypothetical protein